MKTEDAFSHLDDTVQGFIDLPADEIAKAIVLLDQVRADLGTVWIIGNGGSASTASHFANDLVKACRMRAISVPDLTSVVLAYANDVSLDLSFFLILEKMMNKNDVLVAISCSGRSENILYAIEATWKERLIVLTGYPTETNSLFKHGAEAMITVPAEDIRVQESVHLAICHAIVGALLE